MGLASLSGKAAFALGKLFASSKIVVLQAPQKVFVLKSGQLLTVKEFAKAGALGKQLVYAKPVTLAAGTKVAVCQNATYLLPSAKMVVLASLKLPLVLAVKGSLALVVLGAAAAVAAVTWSGDDYPDVVSMEDHLYKEEHDLERIPWH